MKKVFIVIQNAFSYAGTENVCNFMTKAMGENAEITILSLEGNGKPFYAFEKANKIISLSECNKPLKQAVLIIKKENPDTVFVVSMGRLSVFFAIQAKMQLTQKIKTHTKFIACEHVALDSYPKHIRLLKFLTLKFYNDVIVLTEHDKQLITSWGVNGRVIFNPISFKHYRKESKSFTALAVGRLDPQKGFDILLPIWKEFINLNPDWTLLIAGEGQEKENLVSLANRLGIAEKVIFLGLVKDVNSYFMASDIYLMTSRYEGLPLVLLEAKAWSLPCIAFDCPTGPRDIIVDEQDGYLVPLGDNQLYLTRLNQLANNDELRINFSFEAESTAKKFDELEIIKQWKALLN